MRNLLAAIAGNLAERGYEPEQLVALLQKKHAKEIESELSDIVHIGLMRIASQVSARRTGVLAGFQMELFEEYRVRKILTIIIEDETGIRKIHKAVGSMTISEVRCYVSEKKKPSSRRSSEIDELARMADDLGTFSKSSRSTVDECWKEKRKSG